jgi:hypothetical protein
MGKAYRCDKCGGYSEHEPARRLEDYEGGYGTKPSVARKGEHWLCKACAVAFDAFMEDHDG